QRRFSSAVAAAGIVAVLGMTCVVPAVAQDEVDRLERELNDSKNERDRLDDSLDELNEEKSNLDADRGDLNRSEERRVGKEKRDWSSDVCSSDLSATVFKCCCGCRHCSCPRHDLCCARCCTRRSRSA